MTEDFKKIIDEDIAKCEEEITRGNKESRGTLHGVLISKYTKIIDGFAVGLHNLFYDNDGSYRTDNLRRIKEKLILFKAMGYKNVYAVSENGITVNNNNQLTATINLTFNEAKEKIENMTSLKDSEIEEIHEKIDELEKIINSSERKTKKWDKAKGIINWLANKGVDVAMTIIPLLLKIGTQS